MTWFLSLGWMLVGGFFVFGFWLCARWVWVL